MRKAGRLACGVAVAIAATIAFGPWNRTEPEKPDAGVPATTPAPAGLPPPLAAPGRGRPATATSSAEGPGAGERSTGAPSVDPEFAAVTLHLRRSDGRPVDRATVRSADDDAKIYPWDPHTNSIRLPEGRQTLEVLGGRFGEWRQPEDFAIDVRAGMAPVEVTLRPWRMIVGHLRVAAGGPSVQPSAQLRSVRTGVDDAGFEDRRDACAVELGPPADGWFCFGESGQLSPGTYEVSASPWIYGPAGARRTVTVRDEAVVVELDLPGGDRAEGVIVSVLGPDGRPTEPSLLMVDVRDADGGGGGGQATTESLGEGRYWIPTRLPNYSGQDPVEVTIWIRSATYGERGVVVPVRRNLAPVVVRFESAAELKLAVPSRPDWLARGVNVEVWSPAGSGARLLERTELGADGTATFRRLQPGEVRLTASRAGRAAGLCVELSRLELRSGENDVTVTAPVLHPIRILGTNRYVYVRATDGARTFGIFDGWPGGDVPGLPAGTYEFRSERRTATVELPAVSDVTLTEPPPK